MAPFLRPRRSPWSAGSGLDKKGTVAWCVLRDALPRRKFLS